MIQIDILTTLDYFKFVCNDYIKQINRLCKHCQIEINEKTISKETIFETGRENHKLFYWSLNPNEQLEKPFVTTEKYGIQAIFDIYYYSEVVRVAKRLYTEMQHKIIDNTDTKGLQKVIKQKQLENFKEYQCLNELEEFKTLMNLIDEILFETKTIEPEPPIGKITAGQKYYLLEKLGLFENGLLQGNKIKIEDKQLLVSKLLGVNIRTARAFFNKDEKYIFDPNKKNEIDNLLKKIPKNKG